MLKREGRVVGWLVAVVLTIAATAHAQKDAAADPSKVDKDFAVQGEYVGDVETPDGKVRWGVQVVALGDGKFFGAFYPGGLPGDGWDPQRERLTAEGETRDGVTTFLVNEYTVRVSADGQMTSTNPDGKEVSRPEKVKRESPTMGAKPPQGALVLFGGKEDAAKWEKGRATDDGLLVQGTQTKQKFGGGTLHIEFRLPYEPKGRGQDRGNSGCYLQGRYEVQILDSFGLEGKNNEAGGIYTISSPSVNMCFPPLAWQTYDIDFTPAAFDADGKKTKNARITVRHNGVLVQQNVEVPNPTTAAPNKEDATPGPIYLQDHGHPVRFRNVWFVEKK
jgi:hypothetical protein